jgi:hypothetical protein
MTGLAIIDMLFAKSQTIAPVFPVNLGVRPILLTNNLDVLYNPCADVITG